MDVAEAKVGVSKIVQSGEGGKSRVREKGERE